jgi:dihydrodipicolinate reductase
MLTYIILAHYNGKNQVPQIIGRTGCFKNASKTAKEVSKECNCLVIIRNIDTGNNTVYDNSKE